MLLTAFATRVEHTRATQILRQAEAKIEAAFWAPRPRSAEQKARDQIQMAKAALAQAAELRRYNLSCFGGIYRRDRKVTLQSSASLLELSAKRRRHAAELLARALPSTEQKAA